MELPERNTDGLFPAFAWPGGYPIIYIDRSGMTVCAKCASREIDNAQAVTACDVYWEGPTIQCDDCNDDIQSAYGDPADEVRHDPPTVNGVLAS